jgi:prepilin-type N-terminal cleavage/methylation domain-containing protein
MKKGFTIVEVMIVVAVIGLIAAIIFPILGSCLKNKSINHNNTLIAENPTGSVAENVNSLQINTKAFKVTEERYGDYTIVIVKEQYYPEHVFLVGFNWATKVR